MRRAILLAAFVVLACGERPAEYVLGPQFAVDETVSLTFEWPAFSHPQMAGYAWTLFAAGQPVLSATTQQASIVVSVPVPAVPTSYYVEVAWLHAKSGKANPYHTTEAQIVQPPGDTVLPPPPPPDTTPPDPPPPDTVPPEPPPPDTVAPPPPPVGEWDRVLADTSVVGDVVVPDGEAWLIGAGVSVRGNVRTHSGTIAMRPGSSLRFVGADPEAYVGGGMHYTAQFANDYGIWIGAGPAATGRLDISCTPKAGWNRTGGDPTWRSDDEYWISPTAVGDYSPRRWSPGQAIPRADPRVPVAEVMNITRDCVIEGPAHIHIHSTVPQRIEYVELRGLGIWNSTHGRNTGRYAIHLHMMGNGSRGTVVRGASAIGSRSHVYVAHTSHGVTFSDLVAVHSFGAAVWWDAGDRTNDFVADRIASSGHETPRSVSGETSRVSGVALGSGSNMTIRNSAVSGAKGSNLSNGYHWTTLSVHNNPAIWTFHDNVAHNNQGRGIRFWFNDNDVHHPRQSVLYRNGAHGIENGAYANAVSYSDLLLVDDNVFHQTSARSAGGELVSGYRRVKIYARTGPAFITGHRKLAASGYLEIIDSELVPAAGHPKVFVSKSGEKPFLAHFRRSGVVPADIVWETFTGGTDGSHVIIEHEDGRVWDLRVASGQLTVTLR